MPSLQFPGTCRPSPPMSAGHLVHWLRLWAAMAPTRHSNWSAPALQADAVVQSRQCIGQTGRLPCKQSQVHWGVLTPSGIRSPEAVH